MGDFLFHSAASLRFWRLYQLASRRRIKLRKNESRATSNMRAYTHETKRIRRRRRIEGKTTERCWMRTERKWIDDDRNECAREKFSCTGTRTTTTIRRSNIVPISYRRYRIEIIVLEHANHRISEYVCKRSCQLSENQTMRWITMLRNIRIDETWMNGRTRMREGEWKITTI